MDASNSYTTETLCKVYDAAYEAVMEPYGTNANPVTSDSVERAHEAGLRAVIALSQPTGPSERESGYANGYYMAIETAAQYVENQHVVWDHTDVQVPHIIQCLANGLRGFNESRSPATSGGNK
jgi:hypothetical protein